MPSFKLLLCICLLLCYNDITVNSTVSRRKRDNEAVLYGNQQGSPHLSVKKSRPESLESHMKSEYAHDLPQEQEESLGDTIEYHRRKKLLRRAKRTLVKRSMENEMASNRMLNRKKRYVEDLDPITLEKLKDVLENAYDSYYSENPSGSNYQNNNDEREEPYIFQDPIYFKEPEVIQKRDVPELRNDADKLAYEIVEVNGVTGLFFPLTNALNENKDEYRTKREDLEDIRYNSKLEKLAEKLAEESQ